MREKDARGKLTGRPAPWILAPRKKQGCCPPVLFVSGGNFCADSREQLLIGGVPVRESPNGDPGIFRRAEYCAF